MRKLIILGTAFLSLITAFNSQAYASGEFDAQQETAIQKIIRNYLVTNPEVLVEASKALQQKQLDMMQSSAMKGIIDNKAQIFSAKNDPLAGNNQGDITIVEFFDYQCPHCIEMMPVINTIIRTNPNVRVIFKEFPIFGNVSDFASRAALAANEQGKYFAFHDAIMNAKKRLSKDIILQVAKNTGLDIEQLQKDMNSAKITKTLGDNRELAKALQLVGTPAFVVGPADADDVSAENTTFISGQTTEAVLQNAIDRI